MKKGMPHPKPERPRYYFKEWRKKAGYTQEKLADMIGVTPSSISQLESGKQGFTDSTLEALAWALSCEPADLLGKDPTKQGEVIDLMRVLKEKGLDTLLQRRDLDLIYRLVKELPEKSA